MSTLHFTTPRVIGTRAGLVFPLLLSIALALLSAQTRAAQVQVAVDDNFAGPIQALAAEFQRTTNHTLVVSAGSTGKLFTQIQQGAPFDVFLSADAETPARLTSEGLALENTRFTYAIGRLVLWSAQAGLVDPQATVLGADSTSRMAVADPRMAPYGAAAMQTMARRGVAARWTGRIVLGESVGQAYQLVASKNAALGFVALSQIMRDGKVESGSHWIVPSTFHTPLRQEVVLLRKGASNDGAKAFLKFLAGDSARAIMRGYGYDH